MKYLYVDHEAARELVSERTLQSAEFEVGKLFVSFIRSELKSLPLGAKIAAISNGDGGFVIAPAAKAENYIVFDLEEMPAISRLDENGILLVLQKTLRFAIKLWEGLKPSAHERVLAHGRAVVFPYPIGMQTDLRAVIDREPDEKRRSKREAGIALLVFKFSQGEGEGAAEVPRLTNFRKAGEARENAYVEATQVMQSAPSNDQRDRALAVTQLQASQHARVAFQAGLENWNDVLTNAQREFVNRPLNVPHRIEGPAGTGKTLCLVLKCLKVLRDSRLAGTEHRALFIAHSESTRRSIENLFAINDVENLFGPDTGLMGARQSLLVTTLQQLCARNILRQEISESELVDRDAYESKQVQALYAREAIDKVMIGEFESHRPFLSDSFLKFLAGTDRWVIAEMLRHEISVQIKGRADQDLNKYKKLQRLKIGLPVENEGDRSFVFLMYERYQHELVASAQFDTDDVVLSASSQLNTPLWRRRRLREGYDSIFIDETHLFNLNELSVFHQLTRNDVAQPIAYSVDKSQALGDRGWTNDAFDLAFDPDSRIDETTPTPLNSIFRCSPDIVNLAFSVTSSGATLFTNFHNPLTAAVSAFTAEEERKTAEPVMRFYSSDEAMLTDAFSRAEVMAREMSTAKADVVIIAFGDEIFKDLQERARSHNKPVEIIKSRGDNEAVQRAKQSGRFVLTAPEFVGGLEFCGAVLVGVDGGRVPARGGATYEDSQNYLSYASHQRLYVALTRARFRVEILGTRARGLSSILSSAVQAGLLSAIDS